MPKILVVDDNLEVRTLLGMFIRRAGHQVTLASDAEDALAKVAEDGDFDTAVLDVAMPGMTGLELLVKLRELPGLADLPAVFVSARGKPEDIARGTDLGAEYIVKPFNGEQVISVVSALLDGRRAIA